MNLQIEFPAAAAASSVRRPAAVPAFRAQLPLALFDQIECGLIVCDERGTVHFANHVAGQELASQRVLQCLGDTLQRAPGVSGELDSALRLALQRGRRGMVRLAAAGDQLMVSVLPLALPDTEEPLALLVLGRRQPCSDLGLEMLASSYGLTLAERRVLAALVREARPSEIAREHAVALSTVRTQISSIRAKLGTRSVEGLLLLAAQVPPVTGALRMPVAALLPSKQVRSMPPAVC
jgi:DNA-binding CsgD family transcriptional regulator